MPQPFSIALDKRMRTATPLRPSKEAHVETLVTASKANFQSVCDALDAIDPEVAKTFCSTPINGTTMGKLIDRD